MIPATCCYCKQPLSMGKTFRYGLHEKKTSNVKFQKRGGLQVRTDSTSAHETGGTVTI